MKICNNWSATEVAPGHRGCCGCNCPSAEYTIRALPRPSLLDRVRNACMHAYRALFSKSIATNTSSIFPLHFQFAWGLHLILRSFVPNFVVGALACTAVYLDVLRRIFKFKILLARTVHCSRLHVRNVWLHHPSLGKNQSTRMHFFSAHCNAQTKENVISNETESSSVSGAQK